MQTKEEKNKKNKEYMRKYRERNKEKIKKFREENREMFNKSSKNWRLNNLEKVRETKKDWRKKNPEKVREMKGRYKNTKNGRKVMNEYSRNKRRLDPAVAFREKIRSKTKYKYKLNHQSCMKCSKPAECHHHTTEPYEEDKFIFMCNKCHVRLHKVGDLKW